MADAVQAQQRNLYQTKFAHLEYRDGLVRITPPPPAHLRPPSRACCSTRRATATTNSCGCSRGPVWTTCRPRRSPRHRRRLSPAITTRSTPTSSALEPTFHSCRRTVWRSTKPHTTHPTRRTRHTHQAAAGCSRLNQCRRTVPIPPRPTARTKLRKHAPSRPAPLSITPPPACGRTSSRPRQTLPSPPPRRLPPLPTIPPRSRCLPPQPRRQTRPHRVGPACTRALPAIRAEQDAGAACLCCLGGCSLCYRGGCILCRGGYILCPWRVHP